MTSFLIFVSVLVPIALGFLFLCAFWPADGAVLSDLPLKCFLSVGFGFGISSCIFFLRLLLTGRWVPGFVVCQLAVLAGLCALAFYRTRRNGLLVQSGEPSRGKGAPWLLRCVFAVALFCAVTRFLALSFQEPNGQFDAFGHWNLEARFLYAGGTHLKQYSSLTWAHPDYPLLIPASIAGAWAFPGTQTTIVPCAVAFLFTFSLVGLVSVSISRFRGERQGLLAGLCMLGTPFLIWQGASQYADVPVAYFFVAALAILFWSNETHPHRGFLILSGAAAGLAAWTKNEGLLFTVLFVALYFLMTVVQKGKMNGIRDTFAILTGLAPVLAIVVAHKLYMGQSNDLVAGQHLHESAHKMLDYSRYALITKQMARGIFSFGEWNRLLPLPAILLVYALLAGIDLTDKKNAPCVIVGASLTFLMLAGYFWIYVLTPANLSWHLETSLNRLLLQLLPLSIFVYFALLRAPEQNVS